MDVVEVNNYQLDEELKDNAGKWRGKVLLMVQKGPKPKNGFAMFARFGDFLKTAHQAGAVAVIGGQSGRKSEGMHLTHTGALGFNTYYEIPVVSMAAEDQDQIERYIDRGKMVRPKINVQNRVSDGPVCDPVHVSPAQLPRPRSAIAPQTHARFCSPLSIARYPVTSL